MGTIFSTTVCVEKCVWRKLIYLSYLDRFLHSSFSFQVRFLNILVPVFLICFALFESCLDCFDFPTCAAIYRVSRFFQKLFTFLERQRLVREIKAKHLKISICKKNNRCSHRCSDDHCAITFDSWFFCAVLFAVPIFSDVFIFLFVLLNIFWSRLWSSFSALLISKEIASLLLKNIWAWASLTS